MRELTYRRAWWEVPRLRDSFVRLLVGINQLRENHRPGAAAACRRALAEAEEAAASAGSPAVFPESHPGVETRVERLLGRPAQALAVYGTLAPGRPNHWVLRGIPGVWLRGLVRGTFHPRGWGVTSGYPAMRWDPGAPLHAVSLFCSARLEGQWQRIDEFEGDEYVRVLVPVQTSRGILVANLYAARRGS